MGFVAGLRLVAVAVGRLLLVELVDRLRIVIIVRLVGVVMDGIFRLRFEYVADNGDTVRSEHAYGAKLFAAASDNVSNLSKKVAELHGKVFRALKEDGIIPPPDNVIRVDFQRRKRA